MKIAAIEYSFDVPDKLDKSRHYPEKLSVWEYYTTFYASHGIIFLQKSYSKLEYFLFFNLFTKIFYEKNTIKHDVKYRYETRDIRSFEKTLSFGKINLYRKIQPLNY